MKITIAGLVIVAMAVIVILIQRSRTISEDNYTSKFSSSEYDRYNQAKQKAMEKILGTMHNFSLFELIPVSYSLNYFLEGIPGTGFVTMELIEPDGSGPKPNSIGTYELIAFTKHHMPPSLENSDGHPWNRMEVLFRGMLTQIGNFSSEAVLNPGDTNELYGEDGETEHYMIFDNYAPNDIPFEIEGKTHCLLLCLEVFQSEVNYAREHGSAIVLEKLKELGHYPYSDLDRDPVF